MKAVCKESIFTNHIFFVLDDVVVPHLNGVRIMDALVPDGLHFEATAFEHLNVPVERARSISAREDVFAHEVAPDKILVPPFTAEASNLKEKETIRLEKAFDLRHELLVVADSYMFAHLEAGNLIKLLVDVGLDFTVVKEQELHSVLYFSALLRQSSFGPLQLARRDSHANAFDLEILGTVDQPRAPSAAEVENAIAILHVKELTADISLTILSDFQ